MEATLGTETYNTTLDFFEKEAETKKYSEYWNK